MKNPLLEQESSQAWHKTFAMEANHLVWNLLSKARRSREEDEQMIHAAHASRFHWDEIGTPIHRTRGDWLLSHVYAVLHRPQRALDYACTCLEICQQHQIGDFDLAYAYEAMARAYAALGQKENCEQYLHLAQQADEQIQNIEPEDRKTFFDDFQSGPWSAIQPGERRHFPGGSPLHAKASKALQWSKLCQGPELAASQRRSRLSSKGMARHD